MFLQQVINGLMLGCTYVLVALGYTLIFGLLRLIHMAHGEVLMIGGYVALVIVAYLHGNLFLAMLGAIVITALIGITVYAASIRYVEKGGHLSPLVSTIGVAIVLQEIFTKIFTGEKIAFPQTLVFKNIQVGGLSFNTVQIFIIVLSFAVMFVLYRILKGTMIGKSIRAVSENTETARLLGIRVPWIVVITFALASVLAGIAGVLVGIAYHSIYPLMGIEIGLKGLAIIIIGGMGNVVGAMFSGLLVGLMEVFSVAYISSSYKDAFTFGLMVLILIWKPEGLFGSVAEKR
ncbi:MAG: branched-chain amino acid ABC transporter permease [Desulfobacteraceae bacterium]|nr:MAG: branched-chain amino acid ABC transporter permease [Desulfobacteraceae bacterium]